MSHHYRPLLLILALLLAACRAPAPTGTPISDVKATAPPATAALTATSTRPAPTGAAPTVVPTTIAPTAAAATATPANTATPPPPSATPTRPAPTPTQTNPQSPTTTPSPTPPASGLAILNFSADVAEADPGDTMTLSWEVANAATVTLWRLAPTGQLADFWDVAAVDTFTYEIGLFERNQTTFMLFAGDDSEGRVQASLSIRLRCTGEWFLTNPPNICPFDPPLAGTSAEQTFEHGVMIWVEAEMRIYVLYDDGTSPQWAVFSDDWDESQPVDDPSLTPPAGYYQPIRGFGLVWRNQPRVFGRLGWATALEQSGSSLIQRTSYARYNETYVLALDGQVWYLKAERSGWEKIPP